MSNIRKVISTFLEVSGDKVCCPFHGEKTPSLMIYDDTESFHCYGCGEDGDAIDFIKKYEEVGFKQAKETVLEILDLQDSQWGDVKRKKEGVRVTIEKYEPLDKEEITKLIKDTGYVSNGYRGIRDDINKFFGHLTKLNEEGEPIRRYYPETNADGKLTGYKCRNLPKDFSHGNIGKTGSKNQLSGQVKFKSGGKYVLVVGGEEDKAAAYQMMVDSQKDLSYNTIAVVSPTTGELTAAKQCALNYEFLDMFENIIIGMDNDEAGRKATEAIAESLPKDKVRIVRWSGKDPNDMLLNGKQRQFMSDFWNSKPYIPEGVKTAADGFDEIMEELVKKRITLPPYMHKMQDMMGGGIIQGRILNIIADTSAGKSTHVNRMVYHWIFNSPVTPTVVSLEATAGQYMIEMLSVHIRENLRWKLTEEQFVEFLKTEEADKLKYELCYREDGSPRFFILDDRAGNIKDLEKELEMLYRKHGSKLFVIDVTTDLCRGSSEAYAEDHMNFQRNMVKNGVTIANVMHTRKPQQNADGSSRKVTEYDVLGTGSFVQSAAYNIVLNRQKLAEDDVERNTTEVDLPKCRGGKTGSAGKWYYDFSTTLVHDLDDWLESKGKIYPKQEEIDTTIKVEEKVSVDVTPSTDENYTPPF